MQYDFEEILDTIKMTEIEHFDIRTVTLGISLRDCVDRNIEMTKQKIYESNVYLDDISLIRLWDSALKSPISLQNRKKC